MAKFKTKLVAAIIILAVLAGAWLMDGSLSSNSIVLVDLTATEVGYGLLPEDNFAAKASYPLLPEDNFVAKASYPLLPEDDSVAIADSNADFTSNQSPELDNEVATDTTADDEATINEADIILDESDQPAEVLTIIDSEPTTTETTTDEATTTTPEASSISNDGAFYVTLSISVNTLLANIHLLCPEKHELVPANGIIFPPTLVRTYEGESVFNVLQREMRQARIHMAARFTPIFDSAYIEAIKNIYEFDAGPLSGWMYMVNGVFPDFGSSKYILSPGDVVEWLYTVDLGRDIGGGGRQWQ